MGMLRSATPKRRKRLLNQFYEGHLPEKGMVSRYGLEDDLREMQTYSRALERAEDASEAMSGLKQRMIERKIPVPKTAPTPKGFRDYGYGMSGARTIASDLTEVFPKAKRSKIKGIVKRSPAALYKYLASQVSAYPMSPERRWGANSLLEKWLVSGKGKAFKPRPPHKYMKTHKTKGGKVVTEEYKKKQPEYQPEAHVWRGYGSDRPLLARTSDVFVSPHPQVATSFGDLVARIPLSRYGNVKYSPDVGLKFEGAVSSGYKWRKKRLAKIKKRMLKGKGYKKFIYPGMNAPLRDYETVLPTVGPKDIGELYSSHDYKLHPLRLKLPKRMQTAGKRTVPATGENLLSHPVTKSLSEFVTPIM